MADSSNMDEWEDITELCKAASSQMTMASPVLCVEDFSMLEAMSAVEIMDAQMDQCYGIGGSLTESSMVEIADDKFSYSVAVKLLQSLIVYETAFLDGASLLEYTYQCKFAWESCYKQFTNLSISTNYPLRAVVAFCKNQMLSINTVCSAVLNADIYEDDDFQPPSSIKLPKASETGKESMMEIDILLVELHEVCGSETVGLRHVSGAATAYEEAKKEQDACNQMIQLLQLRRHLHEFYTEFDAVILESTRSSVKVAASSATLSTPTIEEGTVCAGEEEGAVVSTEQSSEAEKEEVDPNAVLGRLHHRIYATCEHCDEKISAVIALPLADITSHKDLPELDFAFDSSLVKVHIAAPLRTTALQSFAKSLLYLKNIVNEIMKLCGTIKLLRNAEESGTLTFDDVFNTVWGVCCSSGTTHLQLMSRSFLVSFVQSQSSKMSLLIRRSKSSYGIPQCVLVNDLYRRWCDESLSRYCLNTLKYICTHHARLLNRLDLLITTWGTLVHESTAVDNNFRIVNEIDDDRQQWCTFWSMLQVMNIMDRHMGVTIEMNLLCPMELDYFYLYWDYICSTKSWVSERLREVRFLLDKALHDDREAQAAAQLALSKKKKKQSVQSSPVPVLKPPSTDELLTKAKGHMCRGLFRELIGIEEMGCITKTENPYTSWETRFLQRFRAFQSVQNPPPLAFSEYLNIFKKDIVIDKKELFSSSNICYQNAKMFADSARKQLSVINTMCTKEEAMTAAFANSAALQGFTPPSALVLKNSLEEEKLIISFTKVSLTNIVNLTRVVSALPTGDAETAPKVPGIDISFKTHGHFPSISFK